MIALITEHTHWLTTKEAIRQCTLTLQNWGITFQDIQNLEGRKRNSQDMTNSTKSIGRQRQIAVFPDSGDEWQHMQWLRAGFFSEEDIDES